MTNVDEQGTGTRRSRHYRDVALSMLGPACAFVVTLARLTSRQELVVQALTPLLFAAVLVGAAYAGRWAALATVAIAAFGLGLGTDDPDRAFTVVAIGALVAVALVTGELRDRAERAERAADVANARFKRVQLRDPLTGMLDRRGFELAVAIEIAREARSGGRLALLIVRLAEMNATNLRFGRSIGDTLVQVLADAVERRIRQSDISARVAEDQIAVILPDTDRAGAQVMASHVLARFQQDLRGMVPADLVVHADSGVAIFPDDGRGMDELMTKAEGALRGEVSAAARP